METLCPGDRLDTYKITAVLHDGEMAHVYKAVDLLLNETVVLKIPLDDILNRPILYYQYQNEEKIGGYLSHDRVVRFLRRDRSGIYLVMEYIKGVDLRRLLTKKRRLPLDIACSYIRQIAEGVEYLHSQSIIHLDLKPENIMVTPDNTVKILDFGLANHLAHQDLLASDLPGPKGTPFYIAPEQICGRRDYKESDIYSLGILFYEMLTAQLPYDRSKNLSRVRDRIKQDPIPPRHYDRNIPPSIQHIILQTLARRPKQRYRLVADFLLALDNHRGLPPSVQGELVTKPLPFLRFFHFAGCSAIVDTPRQPEKPPRKADRQILACIVDHDYADLVIEKVKREVLIRGGDITLLVVTGSDGADNLVKYAVEVEGRTFSKRLDNYITTLKRYGLNPVVRIKRGEPDELIVETAAEIDANTVILGPPRSPKGLATLLGGSTIQKVMRHSGARVIIADAVTPASPPFFSHADELSPALLAEIDLFLSDTWVHHLNWFSETSHGFLDGTGQHGQQDEADETTCHFGRWLTRFPESSRWAELTTRVIEPHRKFHQVVIQMAEMAADNDLTGMISLYHHKAMPLSAAFQEGLQQISDQLRQQQRNRPAPGQT